MRNLVMAAMLAPLFTGAAIATAAGDPAVLPPGGAAVLMWTPEQQVWTVSMFPADKLVVVINSAWPVAWSEDINQVRMQYLKAIRAAARSL
jgi:hypothetical protein